MYLEFILLKKCSFIVNLLRNNQVADKEERVSDKHIQLADNTYALNAKIKTVTGNQC